MSDTLTQLLSFVRLLNDYRHVKRRLFVNGEDRPENDVEHSYQLAILCWYIIETEKLDLDLNLVLKYALLHDLVEVYAGDTPFYSEDKKLKDSKREREHIALEKLIKNFPGFSAIGTYISEYEARVNLESRFVYAADKLQPMLNIYEDNGRSWKADHITYENAANLPLSKIAFDPTIEKIFNEFIQLVAKDKEKYFNQDETGN